MKKGFSREGNQSLEWLRIKYSCKSSFLNLRIRNEHLYKGWSFTFQSWYSITGKKIQAILDKRSDSLFTVFPYHLSICSPGNNSISEMRMGKSTKEMLILHCLFIGEAIHQVCYKQGKHGCSRMFQLCEVSQHLAEHVAMNSPVGTGSQFACVGKKTQNICSCFHVTVGQQA